jgi:hypothetical protein
MANEPAYSTFGGTVTPDEAYRLLMHHLSEARNQCLVISHLRMTDDTDAARLIAKGWAAMEEMLAMTQEQVRQIAMRKVRT